MRGIRGVQIIVMESLVSDRVCVRVYFCFLCALNLGVKWKRMVEVLSVCDKNEGDGGNT